MNGDEEDEEDVVDDNIDPDAPESDGYVSEDDDIQPAGPMRRTHRRKILTFQLDVNSLDASLEEKNHDKFEIPSTENVITGYIPDPTDKSKKKKLPVKFANQKPSVTSRQRRSDVITNTPGLTASPS